MAYRLGIAGTGLIVKTMLSMIGSVPAYELYAICGRPEHPENAENLKKQYGITHSYLDYEEMLRSEAEVIYIGMPNHLHYDYTKRALMAGKHVIVEKPFTVEYEQAEELVRLAEEKKLFLFEAITTLYLPNYQKIRALLPKLGDIKIVQCNFSQYSSRYDKFKQGIIAPAFDPECAGGALLDLNVYNIHFVLGLFGEPIKAEYHPNMERGIDTSGILVMHYEDFQCVCIAAKDCDAPIVTVIQGTAGSVFMDAKTNSCDHFRLELRGEQPVEYCENIQPHRMVDEFQTFAEVMESMNYEKCQVMLGHSLQVMKVLSEARTVAS